LLVVKRNNNQKIYENTCRASIKKFRPWKSRGLPVVQGYACNCNPRCTLTEIYPLFLVCKPSLELSTYVGTCRDRKSIKSILFGTMH